MAHRDDWIGESNWRSRHATFPTKHLGPQRACPTCGHFYTAGHFRAHLRSFLHSEQRAWWTR